METKEETKETIEIKETPTDLTFEEFKEEKDKDNLNKCEFCNKEYKSRGSLWKHKQKCDKKKENKEVKKDLVIVDPENDVDDEKLEKLREQLKKMVMMNPNFDLNKQITFNQDLSKIEKMEADEIKMRIMDFQRKTSLKLDKKVSKTALDISAYVIGSLVDCVEELKMEFQKDELLQESVNDVLSSELLCYIDPKIKVAGLVAMDTGNAYVKSLPRKQIQQELLKSEQELKESLEQKLEVEIQDQ